MRSKLVALVVWITATGALAGEADDRLATAIAKDSLAEAAAALDAGADPNAGTTAGITAAGSAALFSRPEILRLLLDHGAKPDLGPAFMAMNGVALLGELDEWTPEGRARALEVVRVMLSKKPPLDVLVRRGPTSKSYLMMAAEAGFPDLVRLLLDAGANPNFKNGGGYTAIDYAVDRPSRTSRATAAQRVETVKALLAAGARTDRAGADHITPKERAKRSGVPEIAAMFP